MTTSSQIYVGIDVSKDSLDVAVLGEKRSRQVRNSWKGIGTLAAELHKRKPRLIVVEATGGYEEGVVEGMFEAGLPVALVSPQRVRQYAKACGLLAKTDGLDAQNLAEYGKNIQPRQYVAKSKAGKRLSDLLSRRRQLGEMRKAEKNRLRRAHLEIKSSLEAVIDCLKTEIRRMDKEVEKLMKEEETLRSRRS